MLVTKNAKDDEHHGEMSNCYLFASSLSKCNKKSVIMPKKQLSDPVTTTVQHNK